MYSFHRSFLIVILLSAILFSCFGWMASTMLQILGKDMTKFISNSDDDQQSVQDVDILIAKWNRHYFMAFDFVHQFNRCFGCLLLVLIAPVFIRVISTSFIMMIELKDGKWTISATINLVVLFINFMAFILTANIPHRIRQEVN